MHAQLVPRVLPLRSHAIPAEDVYVELGRAQRLVV
jgi:hypothetical protein